MKRTLIKNALTVFTVCWLLTGTVATVSAQDESELRRKGNKKREARPPKPPKPPKATQPEAPQTRQSVPQAPQPKSEPGIFGILVDGTSNEGLIGAGILIVQLQTGVTTQVDGSFHIKNVPPGNYTVSVNYLGYLPLKKEITVPPSGSINLGFLGMEPSDIGLEEVKIIANYADSRQTPVATTGVDSKHIEENYTIAEDLPVVVRFAPSTYISRQGGGFGDSRVSVRGFEQENLAVMINGVPINDMEFGKVYWVNFMGLSDVTRSVQVQRGMGVSKLAISSVGGTMNFITRTTDVEKGGSLTVESANFLQRRTAFFNPMSVRTSLMLSTGLTEKNWAITFQGSNVSGPGYFDQQYINFWSYFLSASKKLNDKHTFVITLLGAPQSHGENLSPISLAQLDTLGRRYNPNWGYDRGTPRPGFNFYHKPQINFNHYWTISDKTQLTSSAYYSYGTGGGNFTVGGPRTRDGLLDFDLMRSLNRAGVPDTIRDAALQVRRVGHASDFWMNNFRLDQWWAGVISNLRHKVNDKLTLTGGVDLRLFQGHQFFQVDDLLGGDFVVDRSDVNNPLRFLQPGDRAWERKRTYINWYGVFGQTEYKTGRLSLFASFSAVTNTYQRKDYFRNLEGRDDVSVMKVIPSFSIKGGASYNLDEKNRIFFNAGYFTRAPFFGTVFAFSNTPIPNIVNEKIQSLEVGYSHLAGNLGINLTGYVTQYQDKTQNIERVFVLNPDGSSEQVSALITGIQARHIGAEFDLNWQPLKWFSFQNFLSWGYWVYTDNIRANIADFSRTNIRDITLYTNDLRVGNSPQVSIGNSITLRPDNNFYFSVDWFFYDQMFAAYNLVSRTIESNKCQPWRLPSYHLVNLNAAYEFKVSNLDAVLRFAVNNVFDTLYYSEAVDGVNSDAQTAGVFPGYGQTFTLGVTVRWK